MSESSVTITGVGLITGLPCAVSLHRLPDAVDSPPRAGAYRSDSGSDHGIVFDLGDGVRIPARLEAVIHADRGVTLGHASGKTLSLVEHFLAACALSGAHSLRVRVEGAPELPILDGSAQPWCEALQALGFGSPPQPTLRLRHAVFCRHSEQACVYALPADTFGLTYAVDFPHPGLRDVWAHWQADDTDVPDLCGLHSARTFGFVRDLPALLAQGLARGASLDNTLGLTDDGGFTTPLRQPDEPIRHKMLDLLGDMMLTGHSPLAMKAHIVAIGAGHASHIALARQLQAALCTTVPEPAMGDSHPMN